MTFALITLFAPLRAGMSLDPPSAVQGPELIGNGGFFMTYTTGIASASTPGQLNYNGYGVTSWTSIVYNGYNFLFNPVLTGSTAYTSSDHHGAIQLYTFANGGSAIALASLESSARGNFLAACSAFRQGTINQFVSNPTIGQQYVLSFI